MDTPILLLGGTAEGRQLASALELEGRDFVLSLAGRTADPLTVGQARTGGFGGADGLAAELKRGHYGLVIDATHPYATTMTRNAAVACAHTGVPLIRFERPGWGDHRDANQWTWVDGHQKAAEAVAASPARRVLLSVGRQHSLDYFPALADRFVLARVAEPPSGEVPPGWELLISRGPFELAAEHELFTSQRIDCLVTKDSGGQHTSAKLTAAREVGALVVMLRRPAAPAGVAQVQTIDEVLRLVRQGPGR